MRLAAPVLGSPAPPEIAVPSWPIRMAGVSMAGFRNRAENHVDIQVVPYPAITLFFDLGDGLLVEDAGGHPQRGCVVAGFTASRVRGQGRDIDCLQVRLSPLVAHAVFGASAAMSDTVVALEDLWGRDATRTHEQLRAAGSWQDRFTIAEAALARCHQASWEVDPEVAFAWGQMAKHHGRVRIERLAAEVGWSRKRLWSRFGSQVGLLPKQATQLIRFDHAAHRLAAGDRIALVAAESGYVDQSHLHRDVMAFAGVTPAVVAVAPWLAVDSVAWPGTKNAAWVSPRTLRG
jgi:AraC-like DNA-binding protein